MSDPSDEEVDAFMRHLAGGKRPKPPVLVQAAADAARARGDLAEAQQEIAALKRQLADARANETSVDPQNDTSYTGQIAALRQQLADAREALEKIRRIPSMLFPDPGAHSWEAFGQRMCGAWSDVQRIARAELARKGATS